jgi:hypothetical protein
MTRWAQYLDVLGTNEYIGWYEQHPETADVTDWKIATRSR